MQRPSYAHTVILRPQEPCRITDENFIVIDEAIWYHILNAPSTHVSQAEPVIVIRYLARSKKMAVHTDGRDTRSALLTLTQLLINGKPTRFEAFEVIQKDQIRGVIRNAGGMTAEQHMMNLHCRKWDIVYARPHWGERHSCSHF